MMLKRLRVFIFVFLTVTSFMSSLSVQAQSFSGYQNQLSNMHQPRWSLQPRQQLDDDDVRERREEEIVRDVRPVCLDRPD